MQHVASLTNSFEIGLLRPFGRLQETLAVNMFRIGRKWEQAIMYWPILDKGTLYNARNIEVENDCSCSFVACVKVQRSICEWVHARTRKKGIGRNTFSRKGRNFNCQRSWLRTIKDFLLWSLEKKKRNLFVCFQISLFSFVLQVCFHSSKKNTELLPVSLELWTDFSLQICN